MNNLSLFCSSMASSSVLLPIAGSDDYMTSNGIFPILISDDEMSDRQPEESFSDEDNQIVDEKDVEQQVSEETTNGTEKGSRKRKSPVWLEFERHKEQGKNGTIREYGMCIHCQQKITITKDGCTNTFRRHLNKCRDRIAKQKQQKLLGKDFLNEKTSNSELIGKLALHKYDKDKVKELLATMIIVHEYPLKMVEHEFFVSFCQMLNPEFEKLSRNTIKNECMKIFESEKKILKKVLADASKVCLTIDVWTSNQTFGYMCLTCHFVDTEWSPKKCILNFVSLPPAPDDDDHGVLRVLEDAIISSLFDWGLKGKVSSITFDHASSYLSMEIIMEFFRLNGRLNFIDKTFNFVRCCAHVLNRMIQDGLNEIKEVLQNILERSVGAFNMSTMSIDECLCKFVNIAKQRQLRIRKDFMYVLDNVPTRGNSTYAMLEIAIQFRKVFLMYQEREPSNFLLPSFSDMKRVESVCNILEVFSEVSNALSSTYYPTANLLLPELWKIKQTLNDTLLNFEGTIYTKDMVEKMKVKFDEYWDDCDMLMSIAAVLDPRYKMIFIEFCFSKIYSTIESEKNVKLVLTCLQELYSGYVSNVAMNKDYGRKSCNNTSNNAKAKTKARAEFEKWAKKYDTVELRESELDLYLKESRYEYELEDNFNALGWWKLNASKYKILANMARDILSIPISSVASVSSFSAGPRVLNQFHSSLKPDTAEALICSGDWLRSKHALNNIEPDDDDIQSTKLD